MPLSDLLIVYFAFGAPLSVSMYLTASGLSNTRRITLSAATFLVWIPFAAGLIYRHLTNASYVARFVSRKVAGQKNFSTLNRQEVVRSTLVTAGCKLSSHDIREVIERYVGLDDLASQEPPASNRHAESLLMAAGRKPDELGSLCLSRREQRRLEFHKERSRDAFMALYDDLPRQPASWRAVEQGIALAREIGDLPVADDLATLEHSYDDTYSARSMNVDASSRPLVTTASPGLD